MKHFLLFSLSAATCLGRGKIFFANSPPSYQEHQWGGQAPSSYSPFYPSDYENSTAQAFPSWSPINGTSSWSSPSNGSWSTFSNWTSPSSPSYDSFSNFSPSSWNNESWSGNSWSSNSWKESSWGSNSWSNNSSWSTDPWSRSNNSWSSNSTWSTDPWRNDTWANETWYPYSNSSSDSDLWTAPSFSHEHYPTLDTTYDAYEIFNDNWNEGCSSCSLQGGYQDVSLIEQHLDQKIGFNFKGFTHIDLYRLIEGFFSGLNDYDISYEWNSCLSAFTFFFAKGQSLKSEIKEVFNLDNILNLDNSIPVTILQTASDVIGSAEFQLSKCSSLLGEKQFDIVWIIEQGFSFQFKLLEYIVLNFKDLFGKGKTIFMNIKAKDYFRGGQVLGKIVIDITSQE